ncbi:MAG: LysM peptidoglycan-binding domain-containing protein [Chloroflexi bacterium]|nr:LysM peptidoglycan-binding domain-containing protein [Chloroflexota bacterium]MYF80362.1 LysM peptidoglycan-binding domain-containing protein [Chloroflexota bacterium]MYI05525.1 LysM peptidoglycan-binding domain-containing protein [Chloroflexota bacterium]
MSLQEAASSGSFGPRAAQPTDPQRADSPFDPPLADGDPARAEDQSNSPFISPYAISPDADATVSDGNGDEMRAKRRRAWTVVSLAIVVPAAIAAIVAWQLFGSDSASAPTVTRVVTPTAEADAAAAEAASASIAVAVPTSTETAATPETTVSTVTPTATTSETASSSAATAAASVEAEETVDLSGLDPAARLAAWSDIETIEVVSGESLWLIAQNHGTTVTAIATLNNLADPETLSVGQLLMIPVGFAEEVVAVAPAESGAGAAESAADGSTAATTAAAGDRSLSADLANWQTIAPVSIEAGDSLEAIAIANDTSVQAIMALNGITDPNMIYVGDVLLVPVGFQGEVPGIELTTATTSVETNVDTVQQASTTDAATSGDQLATDDEADQLAADDSLAADEGTDSDSLGE